MTPPLSPAPELSADQVRKAVDLSPLAFATTADLEPQTALVGQERAVQALQMGIAMPQPGYNIFASDVAGTGARTQITALLQDEPSLCQRRAIGSMSTISDSPTSPVL